VPHSAARADAAPKTAAITAAKTKAFKSLPRIGSSGFITNRWGRARLGRRGGGIASALVAWIPPNSYQKNAWRNRLLRVSDEIARGGPESENPA
jgi:hypothetical protein